LNKTGLPPCFTPAPLSRTVAP